MHIAYLTTDDVNLDWAAQTALECGATLAPLWPEGAMPKDSFAAVLYDLDHLGHYDPQRVQAILRELLSHPAPLPVGLHGYSLEDEEVATLRAKGVVVSQTFDPEIVRSLCQAVDRSSVATLAPAEDRRDSLETMDDPATFCASVRSLASRSYQVVRQAGSASSACAQEVAELLKWIARLEQQIDRFRRLHKLQFEDLRNWVTSLRRRIESLQIADGQ